MNGGGITVGGDINTTGGNGITVGGAINATNANGIVITGDVNATSTSNSPTELYGFKANNVTCYNPENVY